MRPDQLFVLVGALMTARIRLNALSSVAVAMCAVAFTISGCRTLKPDWKWMGEPDPVIPESVLPIWTDTVLHQPGESGVRGFGGRIYFYHDKGGDPVKVDGSLTVYVFDGEDYGANEPLRKFVFTADQLASHHSKNELGDSYSIWVPWDKVGGPSKSLSLIVRFDGRNGGTAISDASSKLLPGKPKTSDIADDEQESQIRQVAFQNDVNDDNEDSTSNKMKSFVLPLTPSFSVR